MRQIASGVGRRRLRLGLAQHDEPRQDERKRPSKKVMQVCMKGGRARRSPVARPRRREEEARRPVRRPARKQAAEGRGGELGRKDKALVNAANDVLAGKVGAGAALQKAANCMACHSAHKGK